MEINDWPKLWPYIWYNLCSRHHFSVTKGFLDMIHLCFNPRKVNFSDYGWARGAVYKGTKIRDNHLQSFDESSQCFPRSLFQLCNQKFSLFLCLLCLWTFEWALRMSWLMGSCCLECWDNDSWSRAAKLTVMDDYLWYLCLCKQLLWISHNQINYHLVVETQMDHI